MSIAIMKSDKQILIIIVCFYAVLFIGIYIFYLVNPFDNACIKGNCVNGKGTYAYHSGMIYEGEWRNSMRHGKGKLTYLDKYTYEGEWKKNKMDGHGTIVYYYYKYVGEWKSGNKNGKGTIFFSGKKYEGHFKNNNMDGSGTLLYPGGFKWVGEWKNSAIYNGKGTIISNEGIRYDGQMNAGKMYGEVTIIYPDGRKFVGELINSQNYIHGTMQDPDGKKYNKTLGNDKFLFN